MKIGDIFRFSANSNTYYKKISELEFDEEGVCWTDYNLLNLSTNQPTLRCGNPMCYPQQDADPQELRRRSRRTNMFSFDEEED